MIEVPYAIADEGTPEGRKVSGFWKMEIGMLERIAQFGIPAEVESYHGLVQKLPDRKLTGWLLILLVLSVGTITIGVATYTLAILSNPVIEYFIGMFGALIVFVVTVFIYNFRQKAGW
jgi:hypothetical protein